jgi:hypothetical protein
MNSKTKKYFTHFVHENSDSEYKQDSTILSETDIEKWAENVAKTDEIPHFLEDKTLENIQQEIINVFIREKIPNELFLPKLKDYYYIDKICDIKRGKHVRWIRKTNDKPVSLTNGGIVADIKFLENGIYILVKNTRNQFIQYKYDDCITFQKLSVDELLFLHVQNYH